MIQSKLRSIKFLTTLALLTAVLISIIYANSLTDEFSFDDEFLILKNKGIKNIANLKAVLFDSLVIPQRPVTSLSFAIDYYFWGISPEGYHLSNIIYYILSTVAFIILVSLISESKLITVLFAIFFSTHPIHTETVSSLLGRSDLLCAIFLALSFIFFLLFRRDDGKTTHFFSLLSLVFYFLSMLSKETGIILIGLIILYEYCFRKDFKFSKSLLLYIPFFFSMILYILYWKSSPQSSVVSLASSGSGLAFSDRLIIMVKVIAKYTVLLFLPVNLCTWYNLSPLISFLNLRFLISLVIIMALLLLPVVYRKSKEIFFFLLWSYLSFLPISNIIPIPGSMMAERWIYITSAGFCALLALSIERLFAEKSLQIISYGLIAAITLFFCIRTAERNPTFRNNISIFQDIARCCPDFAPAHNSLGVAFAREGKYQSAIAKFNKALELYPKYDRPHFNLGKIYINQGKALEAQDEFIKAVNLMPEEPEYRFYLAKAFEKNGEMDKALTEYEKFLKLASENDLRIESIKAFIAKYSYGKEKLR